MSTIDPRHPVLVGAHELSVRTADAEPVSMMVDAALSALADASVDLSARVQSVRVVKGIWPYKDPGRLVAQALSLGDNVTTALTGVGGNATYDLLNQTAAEIATGTLDVAIICGAESMRTRRRDRAQGRRSIYLGEVDGAAPDLVVAGDIEMSDELDGAVGADHPVNFYAMAESVIRHRGGEAPDEHLARIATLWAQGSAVASENPDAWIQEPKTATQIATTDSDNRMVASPYTKLLTSNINVDQGAAVVLCAYETALECGVPTDAMVFLASGSGAADHLPIRARLELDRSPAFRLSAERALSLAGQNIHDIEHLDLYSCFPASVQLAQTELGVDPTRSFTMTGGLTFAGGPFNGYCTQALAHAVAVLRGTQDVAFLYGNGGYFSKHSVVVLTANAPTTSFLYERAQASVDALPARVVTSFAGTRGIIEAYTVTFDRGGTPAEGILSVLDPEGVRSWARILSAIAIEELLGADQVGRTVDLSSDVGQLISVASFM